MDAQKEAKKEKKKAQEKPFQTVKIVGDFFYNVFLQGCTTAAVVFSLLILFTLFWNTAPVSATVFENAYVSFDLPSHWQCRQKRREWLCRPEGTSNKQAVIVITGKHPGPGENYKTLKNQLTNPRSIQGKLGERIMSKVVRSQERTLHGEKWLVTLHLNSEIKDFYTYYLMTTKKNLAVLITMNAHKNHYPQYQPDFKKLINSLKLTAGPGLLTSSSRTASEGQTSPPRLVQDTTPQKTTSSSTWSQLTLLLMGALVIVLGAIIYLLVK